MFAFLMNTITAIPMSGNEVQISFDRTLATITATFVLFLLGQLVVALRWGSKIDTTIQTVMTRHDALMEQISGIRSDMDDMKKSLTSIAISETRLDNDDRRIQDHDVRIRTLEHQLWQMTKPPKE